MWCLFTHIDHSLFGLDHVRYHSICDHQQDKVLRAICNLCCTAGECAQTDTRTPTHTHRHTHRNTQVKANNLCKENIRRPVCFRGNELQMRLIQALSKNTKQNLLRAYIELLMLL